MENVPSSIGELKHLRYLDISGNYFERLPDSITKLLNLCMLNISECVHLVALPNDFRKLINLRHLSIRNCGHLKHMPPGFGEFKSLQHFDEFMVGRGPGGGQRSKLDMLVGLKLRGELRIRFENDTDDDWNGIECWQPPVTLQRLIIYGHKGTRIPHWGNGRVDDLSLLPKLTHQSLFYCSRVKCFPPFGHLPNLKRIHLFAMEELEYIEDEDSPTIADGSNASFLPNLANLRLDGLPKLKGWSRKQSSTEQEALLSFPCLSRLYIGGCPELMPMPTAPRLHTLALNSVNAKVIPQYTSSSSSLQVIDILGCDGLTSFPSESLTSLQCLSIQYCDELKEVKLPPSHLNIVDCLSLLDCRELELWEEGKRGVDWDSLPKLHELYVDEIRSPTRLPMRIQYHQARFQLKIADE